MEMVPEQDGRSWDLSKQFLRGRKIVFVFTLVLWNLAVEQWWFIQHRAKRSLLIHMFKEIKVLFLYYVRTEPAANGAVA